MRTEAISDLPDPSTLHGRASRGGEVDWGDPLPETRALIELYGADATARSLETLQSMVEVEPVVTSAIVAAIPDNGTAYQLASRLKSPHSLARKFRDAAEDGRSLQVDDVLRYTVLTRSPADLVSVAKSTVHDLNASGLRTCFAVNSYTDGSRYKGLHAGLETAAGQRVEVQFHSIESVKVKEATTPAYETERSATATPDERAAARAHCVKLSDSLTTPPGLADLTKLGGVRVQVRNYSDSRAAVSTPKPVVGKEQDRPPFTPKPPQIGRAEGMNR